MSDLGKNGGGGNGAETKGAGAKEIGVAVVVGCTGNRGELLNIGIAGNIIWE